MTRNKILVLATFIVLAGLVVLGQQIYSVFSGTAKINGQNAGVGSNVIACIGDVKSGEVKTYLGTDGNTWYAIPVYNGTTGNDVTFRVDGLVANEVGAYVVGVLQPLNLTVSQAVYTIHLEPGWNLISIPLETKYDGCVNVL